jgi:hypothetical protein
MIKRLFRGVRTGLRTQEKASNNKAGELAYNYPDAWYKDGNTGKVNLHAFPALDIDNKTLRVIAGKLKLK